MMSAKWSRTYWADLGERVGASFLGGVLALLGTAGSTPLDWNDPALLWPVVGLPTAFALVKGLLANLQSPESGPSLLPAPPAPELPPARGEDGAADWVALVAVAALFVATLAICGVRLG